MPFFGSIFCGSIFCSSIFCSSIDICHHKVVTVATCVGAAGKSDVHNKVGGNKTPVMIVAALVIVFAVVVGVLISKSHQDVLGD